MAEDLDAGLGEAPGDCWWPVPADELGRPRSPFRPGDVLQVSCPPREAEVGSAEREIELLHGAGSCVCPLAALVEASRYLAAELVTRPGWAGCRAWPPAG
jgi:hypothetical protein